MDLFIQKDKKIIMKQPTPLWQVISMFITVAIFAFTGILSANSKISRLEERLEYVQSRQAEMQLISDKKFDKMDVKIDLIQSDIRQILVNTAAAK